MRSLKIVPRVTLGFQHFFTPFYVGPATRRVLTVDEVVEELQNSDSENDDDSEDDFVGYLDEEEMQQRWMGEMEGNSDLEGNGSEREE